MMKRILYSLALLPLCAAGAVLVKFYLLSPNYRPAPELHAPSTPEAIERGRYLANGPAMCVSCHSESDPSLPGDPVIAGGEFQGRHFEMPGFPGEVKAANLTPDVETGLGAWTDGEIVRAMREGVSRDGRALFPMMPYRTLAEVLSDDDALAIVAYLRSLPAGKRAVGPTTLKFPLSLLIRTGPQPLERVAPPPPPQSDVLARGKWLMKIGNCTSCHDTHDDRHEPLPGKHLAGGDPFPLPNGGKVYAANISSDAATGIGAYSEADLERVLTDGVNKAGRPLYFMPFPMLKNLTAEDRKALIMALKQEPPVPNIVPPPQLAQVAQSR